MNTLDTIASKIAALPPNLRAKVLDFVQFVKLRHGLPAAPASSDLAPDAGDSPLFQALERTGFVGGVETNEQLSTTYKERLDFTPGLESNHDLGGHRSLAGPGGSRRRLPRALPRFFPR